MKYPRYALLLHQMFRKKNPILLTVFVTNRCNLDCRMCLNYKHLNSQEDEMTVEQYEAVAKSMRPLLWLIFSGGEPFIRDDLSSIAAVFARHTFVRNISLPTNGCLQDSILEQTERMLVDNPDVFFNVNLSVLGLEKVHDSITRRDGSFNKLVRTRWALEDFRKRYRNFRLSATITYSGYNHESVLQTLSWVFDELRTDSISLNLTRGDTAEAVAKEYDIANFIEGANRIVTAYKNRQFGYDKGRMKFFLPFYKAYYKRLVDEYAGKQFCSYCHAGRSTAVIYPNGDVYPCEILDKKYGNLRDANYDFEMVWNTPEAKETRRWIYSSKCQCYHGCYVSANLLVEPGFLIPIALKAVWQGLVKSLSGRQGL